MAKAERINQLYSLLKNARHPVSKQQLQEKMECKEKSVRRYISELRDTHNLDIVYNRKRNGYQLLDDPEQGIEIPGYVFNSRETHALLLIDRLVANLESGLLSEDLQPLRQHMVKIRQKLSGNSQALTDQSIDRIRIITIGKRTRDSKHLMAATLAVLKRQKVQISYAARSRTNNDQINNDKDNCKTTRIISPQRLTHYRDNWFLDAWCHQKEALRTFSLDRIDTLKTVSGQTLNLDNQQLDDYYARTFGIFGGAIRGVAILRFNAYRASWVAEEQWHPDQIGSWQEDGSYQLEIPYGIDHELIGDILKYGADVEVLAPRELRQKVQQALKQAIKKYA